MQQLHSVVVTLEFYVCSNVDTQQLSSFGSEQRVLVLSPAEPSNTPIEET